MKSDLFMSPRALVSCISGSEQSLEPLTTALAKAHYQLLNDSAGRGADIGLVDLRGQTLSVKKAKALAARLRKKAPESPIFFLVDPDSDARMRVGIRRLGEVIPVADEFDHVIERCRQMIRLRNIAEEAGERLKTLASLNRLVEFPMIESSGNGPRILIAGEPGAAAIAAINAVGAKAETCICVLTAGQAMRALDHQEFDCALFLPTPENNPLNSLAKALRRHRNYTDMPVIQIADHVRDLSIYARKGVRDFVLNDHISSDLAAKTAIATRRGRLTKAMRGFLQTCRGESVRDASSGAFTSLFLTEHGGRICARADQTGRPLSTIVIKLSARAKAPLHNERKALHHAARTINRITRPEDLVARIGPENFAIICPATIAEDAKTISQRIDGVLTSTAFRSNDDDAPFAIKVAANVSQRAAGASIEETVATALQGFMKAPASGAVKS